MKDEFPILMRFSDQLLGEYTADVVRRGCAPLHRCQVSVGPYLTQLLRMNVVHPDFIGYLLFWKSHRIDASETITRYCPVCPCGKD